MVEVRSASFGLSEADAESRLCRTLLAISGSTWPGAKRREALASNCQASLTVDPVSPYGPAIGGAPMVSVQSAFVGGNDLGFEEAGGQGCNGEGEHYRLVEPHLAVVPMKMRKPALNGVRLGPKVLVS